MMKLQVFCVLLVASQGMDPCNSVQLGKPAPCVYSTSSCKSGLIQWNYPEDMCEWTFSPRGASSVLISANWRTATDVNVSFYDGHAPNAKLLGTVVGRGDDASATLVSRTGTIFVRLNGPPSMMTYALIFDYTLTINPDRCAVNEGNCRACLLAGCSMHGAGSACVNTCPAETTCWSATSGSAANVCGSRKTFIDQRTLCSARGTCRSCVAGGQCKWGGPVGQSPACHSSCEPNMKCEFSSCPVQQKCSNFTTCEGCLNAGCSVTGLTGLNCVPECPTDIPCFRPSKSNQCQARRERAAEKALCDSLSHDCGACVEHGCQWNLKGQPGTNCITGCGFFPCEIATQCPAGSMVSMFWGVLVSMFREPSGHVSSSTTVFQSPRPRRARLENRTRPAKATARP
jgi:hypothetical protein